MEFNFNLNGVKIPGMPGSDKIANVDSMQIGIKADFTGLLNAYSPENISKALDNNIRIVQFLAENQDTVHAAIKTVLRALDQIVTYKPGQVPINETFEQGYSNGRCDEAKDQQYGRTERGECFGDDCSGNCDGTKCDKETLASVNAFAMGHKVECSGDED